MNVSLNGVLFLIVATTVAVSAVGVVASKSIVRSAVWLLLTLIGISFVYFLLGAEFLGAAHLIVYVGGTLVLVAFGGMLTEAGPFAGPRVPAVGWVVGGCVALGLFALLASASLHLAQPPATPDGPLPGVAVLGLGFLGVTANPTDRAFLFPFEIVSVHLLVVLVGAAYLARAKGKVRAPGVK